MAKVDYNPIIQEFTELIRKFNRKINLVSRKDMDNLVTRHIDDGVLSHAEYLDSFRLPDGYSMYDLGSGNGIPGVIWAALSPDINFYLVDTDERKAEFLKYVVSKLGLSNVKVLNSSYQSLELEEKCVFLCRGLTSIEEFLIESNPFFERNGFFIKGSTWNNEVGHLDTNNFRYSDYSLSDGTRRSLVYYQK